MEKQDIEKFIEDVRDHPILYNLIRPGYKNVRDKLKVWAQISAAHKMSVEDSKKRWKHLRDCYARHLRKKSVSGQVAEDPEDSEWWICSAQMDFLRDQLRPRKTGGNYHNQRVDEEDAILEYRPFSPALADILPGTSASFDDESTSSTQQMPYGQRKRRIPIHLTSRIHL